MKDRFLSIGRAMAVVLLGGLLLAAPPCRAAGPDRVVARALWVDPTAALGLDQVQAQPFQPVGDLVSRGYSPAALWLRLDVAPPPDGKVVLMVSPTYLDDVRLYVPQADGRWSERRSGDTLPFAGRETGFTAFAWRLNLPPGAATRVYLRVTSTSTMLVMAKALDEDGAVQAEGSAGAMVSALTVLNLALLLVSVVRWLTLKDALWAYAAVWQLFGALLTPVITGYSTRLLWPQHPAWPDLAVGVLGILHNATGELYFWHFIRAFGARRWMLRLVAMFMVCIFLLLVPLALGAVRTALQLNMLFVLLGGVTALVFPFLLRFDDPVTKALTRTLYVGLGIYLALLIGAPLLGAFAPAMSKVGLMTSLSNLFASAMMMAILSRRAQLQMREHERTKAEAQHNAERLAWERQRSEETSNLMGMLLHELKNPLAAIRLSVMTLNAQGVAAAGGANTMGVVDRSVDAIDELLERCRQVDKLDQGLSVVELADLDIAETVRRCIAELPPTLRERVHLEVPATVTARADALLLRTIVHNLLDNALHYSPAGSPVRVRLDAAPQARLRVANAPGPAGRPDPARVFTKYYREAHTQRRSGAGLGLYLVHGLAAAQGGRVRLLEDAADVVFEVLWSAAGRSEGPTLERI